MRVTLFLLLLALSVLASQAQTQAPAPIERREPVALPEAPQPAPTQAQIHADKEWEHLVRGTRYSRPEVRIQAVGDTMRCDVDKVTPEEIFCTQHRANNDPLYGLIRPKQQYRVPRREIRDIRVGGREVSTVLGAAIGAGAGVGLGSANAQSRAEGGQVYGALIFGMLGGFIGHALPLAGHPIYQQP